MGWPNRVRCSWGGEIVLSEGEFEFGKADWCYASWVWWIKLL